MSPPEFEAWVAELRDEAVSLEPKAIKAREAENQIVSLEANKEQLVGQVEELEKTRDLIRDQVNALETREQTLTSTVRDLEEKESNAERRIAAIRKEQEGLAALGLSQEALHSVLSRIRAIADRHRLPLDEASNQLLAWLDELDEATGIQVLIRQLD